MVRTPRWLFFVGGCVLVVVFLLAGLMTPLGNVGRGMTLPIIRAASFLGSTIMSPIQSGLSARQQNDRILTLERQLQTNAVDTAKMQALEEENKVLSEQAKFLTSSGFDSIGAHVISRDVYDDRALLLIDRGLDDHLEVGQAVITGNGILLGKISALKQQVATVELLTDPRSRISASLSGTGSLDGIIEGKGNGAAQMTYIPASQHVAVDQIVTTAGAEAKVPAHLALGVVNAVYGKPTDPFLTAAIEPLVHIEEVSLVSILRPSAANASL